MKDSFLDSWFHVLGYGNPSAPIWFVGIEFSGETSNIGPKSCEVFHLGKRRLSYDRSPNAEDKSLAWRTPAEIISALNDHISALPDWQTRWDRMFVTNVAPLPRKNVTIEHIGIDAVAYRTRVIAERVPMLIDCLESEACKVMVFHGKGARIQYQLLQGFGFSEAEQQAATTEGSSMLVFNRNGKHVVFANTFTRGAVHFPKKDRSRLVELLRDWRREWKNGVRDNLSYVVADQKIDP